ncbi:MAG: DUF167 domain-containing protein [Candidatus Omnitrophota bacterium]
MRVDIKVIAGARKNLVKDDDGVLKVYLTAPAVDGKANKALSKILSEHFSVSKNRIEIIKGLKSRHKTINIIEI